jgi:23S rRNA (adenine2503-C2)-methyltransferase
MRSIIECLLDNFPTWLTAQDEPSFRAAQVWRWVFERRAGAFEDMTDLPRALRQLLASQFTIWSTSIVRHDRSADGTEKLLLQLVDGGRIECVLLREGLRRTVCLSTQVGCAMGCVFCASGLNGVERNLTTAEIVEQMLRLQHLLPGDERLSHIVVMGMGEPLANLDRLLPALDVATRQDAFDISARRITISTVGLPAAIDRLAESGSRYHLAVSLHAPHDSLRNELVPVNRNIGIQSILDASDRYFAASGRRLTFEYVLLAGVNDHPSQAAMLAKRLRGRSVLLNVIPYNPVAGLPYRTPSALALKRFRSVLEEAGINVKVRHRKGDKINAACGQLRRSSTVSSARLAVGPNLV